MVCARMKNSNAPALATLLACALNTSVHAVEHGTLSVIQKTSANTAAAVQVSQYLGGTSAVGAIAGDPYGFTILNSGCSKGDYTLQFTTTRADDRMYGVLLSSVAENGRNNSLAPHAGGPGLSWATSHVDFNVDGMWALTQQTLGSATSGIGELNIDVSAAWFPLSEGWLAGNYKSATSFNTTPVIRLGSEFTAGGDGTYKVDLRSLRSFGTPATSQNGVLLVTGGENAARFALSRANADGTFTASVMNNDDVANAYTNSPVAFAYVPATAAGMGQVKAVGRVRSDGSTALQGGSYTVSKLGVGQWLLQIDGLTRDDGTLVISPEGGRAPVGANPVPKNINNFVSYQWNDAQQGWIVQSRDILATLEDGATADEPMFSFVFLTPGEAPVLSYENPQLPGIALTSPANGIAASVGQQLALNTTLDIPAGVTVSKVDFYVGGQLAGTATSAPYNLSWTVDKPGYRVIEAFAYTSNNAVASASRRAIYAEAAVSAPQVPGYSVALLDGGDLESDVTELDPDYVPSATTPWNTLATTPLPEGFTNPGDVRGAPAVNVHGGPVPFNSGILFGTNYAGNNYSDATTRGAIDNNVVAYNSSGNYALKVDDNKQGGGNPIVRPESGRFALGYFPFSNGWVGASVNTDLSIVGGSSNLPSGVTITKSGVSDYLIEGLPMSGNLLAVSQGAASDNFASIGRSLNRWVVRSTDNNGNTEDDSFSFLYVPTNAPQVFSGLVIADGTLTSLNENLTAIGATVTATPNGYEIQFGDGVAVNPSNTALFLSADFNSGNGGDNIYAYYASGNKFVVFSHDLPGITGGVQNSGFRFLAVPVTPVSSSGTDVYVSTPVPVVEEGLASDGPLVFRFARIGGNPSQPLTISYTTTGTATPGVDYQTMTGTVTFPAGVTVVDVPVPTIGDNQFEVDETVVVTVGTGSGYAPAGGAATGTIRNHLYLPSVQTTSFQYGVNGYTTYFGRRVDEAGTNTVETAVQQYAVDGYDAVANSPDVNAILRFENLFGSAAGQIPVGATILKAELVLTTAVADNAQSPGPWVVDRLLFPVDATTNYIQMTQGSNVGVRGLSARTPVAGFGNNAQGDVQAADVTAHVRAWATATDPNDANRGLAIYDASTSDGWNFCTAGNSDPNKRPKLVVSYVAPAMQRQSYSFTADKSVRVVGSSASFDGATLEQAFVDQVTGATQEGIFHFPVAFGATVGAIPLDEEIVRAELVLNTSSSAYTGGSVDARSTGPAAVHRMLVDWTPTSTFGFNGPAVGTDIAIAERTRVAGMGLTSATTFDVTGVVQAWREGNSNFGVNVKPETTDGWQFFWPGATGQFADKVPKLVIYTAKASTASAFEQWATTNGIGGAAQDSDADRDGIPALVEYALGLNPTVFNQMPSLEKNGNNFTLRFLKSSTDPRLSYVIRSSSNLLNWTDETPTVNNPSEISLTVPWGGERGRFFRLSVSYSAN